MLTLTPDNLDALGKRLLGTTDQAEQALAETAQEVFEMIEARVADHRQTGDLERSLELNRDGPGDYRIGHNESMAPHAVFVHWGTRPHEIRPSKKKALRWPSGGAFQFAKVVQHPGYEGDPYLVDAADAAPRIFQRRLAAILEE